MERIIYCCLAQWQGRRRLAFVATNPKHSYPIIRGISGIRYSVEWNAWHVNTEELNLRTRLDQYQVRWVTIHKLKHLGKSFDNPIDPSTIEAIEIYKTWLKINRYSDSTRKNYTSQVYKFFVAFEGHWKEVEN